MLLLLWSMTFWCIFNKLETCHTDTASIGTDILYTEISLMRPVSLMSFSLLQVIIDKAFN